MTNTEFLTVVYVLAGVNAEGIPLTSEQAASGLTRLNGMLSDWKESGIDLGYYPQSVAAATLPLYDDAVEAVEANLAKKIATYNGRSVSPEVWEIADRGYRRLLGDAVKPQEADMRHLPGSIHRSRILTDD